MSEGGVSTPFAGDTDWIGSCERTLRGTAGRDRPFEKTTQKYEDLEILKMSQEEIENTSCI